jgi:hypothetical protein
MLQQSGASQLYNPAGSHNSQKADSLKSEGLFNAITEALISIITKEILVLAMVILCIYYWYFVISQNLIGRGTQIY